MFPPKECPIVVVWIPVLLPIEGFYIGEMVYCCSWVGVVCSMYYINYILNDIFVTHGD